MTLRLALLTIFTASFIYSCSSSNSVVESSSSNEIFPVWYSMSSFQADSNSFSGFGIAIATDSTVAMHRASLEAKKNLDLAIGKISEDIRTQIVSEGNSSAGNTDFILILRNAHADAVEESNLSNHHVINENGKFRAFAEMNISKIELIKQLEVGFKGHPRYWASFSDNSTFQASFK